MSLPWQVKGKKIISANGGTIAELWEIGSPDSPAILAHNAAFIVTACNAHDDLVAALEKVSVASRSWGTDREGLISAMQAVARAALAKVQA